MYMWRCSCLCAKSNYTISHICDLSSYVIYLDKESRKAFLIIIFTLYRICNILCNLYDVPYAMEFTATLH